MVIIVVVYVLDFNAGWDVFIVIELIIKCHKKYPNKTSKVTIKSGP